MRAPASSTQALSSWYVAAFQLPLGPEPMPSRSLARGLRGSGLPRADADRYEQRMRQPGALSPALRWYRAPPLAAGRTVPDCQVPTTYAWGRRDVAQWRRPAELTADHVTGPYRFEVVDAAHWLPEREPAEVAALVVDRVTG